MSRPGIEPGPEASNQGKSHSNSLFIAIGNIYCTSKYESATSVECSLQYVPVSKETPRIILIFKKIPCCVAGEYNPSIRTGYTCEGEELEVSCGPGELIQIVRANYGRFSIAICNDEGRTHWSVNCMSPRTRHILQNR
jgi:hypothetical protein